VGAVSGDDSTLSFSVTSIADLSSRPTAALQSGDRAYVSSKVGTPEGPLFFIDKTSTIPVDNISVIATNSGVGRWLSEALYGGVNDLVIAANAAALALVPTTGRSSGSLAWVQTFRSYFRLDTTSEEAPNNKTVVAADGGGNWLRVLDYRDPSWMTREEWTINATTGNDENEGAMLTPLASWAEFARRVRQIERSITVRIETDLEEAISGTFISPTTGITLTILGIPTDVVDAGSVTTFTNPNTASNIPGTMTSAAVPSFTPYIGRMLIATDGYANWYTPILDASDVGVPVLAFWATEWFDTDKPNNGAEVQIVTLPSVATLQLTLEGGISFSVRLLRMIGASLNDTVSTTVPAVASFGNTWLACEFSGAFAEYNESYYQGCFFNADDPDGQLAVSFWGYGSAALMGGGSRNRTWFLDSGGHTTFQGFIVWAGGGIEVGFSDHQSWPTSIGIWGENLGLGIFHASSTPLGASGSGLVVSAYGSVSGKDIYGTGNQFYGVDVLPGGRVTMLPGAELSITGDVGDLRFDKSNTAIPLLVAGAPVPAAESLTSWAEWLANFGQKVQGNGTGSILSIV
jgi:hypothetical protein